MLLVDLLQPRLDSVTPASRPTLTVTVTPQSFLPRTKLILIMNSVEDHSSRELFRRGLFPSTQFPIVVSVSV